MSPNLNKSIIILGASGFVGKNLSYFLSKYFKVINSYREGVYSLDEYVFFDLNVNSTWDNILKINADYIINCIGYGVVKDEDNLKMMYDVNYLTMSKFYDYLSENNFSGNVIHIGTAFEYDLSTIRIDEQTITLPKSHYGVSKLMISEYLLKKNNLKNYLIIRPFNMFGLFESDSKIIPSLINSQKFNKKIYLSSGLQKRDYFHVNDLAKFLVILIQKYHFNNLPKIINVGSGRTFSIREIANQLTELLPTFDDRLWSWNSLSQREGETMEFFNNSQIANKLGFTTSSLKEGFKQTIKYYWNNES